MKRQDRAAVFSPYTRRFSRTWFLEGLRTLAWVVVISVLIWVYADLQFTGTKEVRATLRIVTPPKSDLVVTSQTRVPLTFRVQGNQHMLDRYVDKLAAGDSAISLDAVRHFQAGFHQEQTVELLSRLPEIQEHGLKVVSAQPAVVEIVLERLELLPAVPVKVEFTGGLAEPAKIEPERLDVRLPAGRMMEIDKSHFALSTESIDLKDAPAGEPITRQVEVLLPWPNMEVSQRKVQVTYKVRQQTDARKLKVAIQVKSPKAWLEDDTWSRFKLLVKDPLEWTREISVQGSRADLEKLKPEDIEAYIVLTEDDKLVVESWLPGEVKVSFPPGARFRLAEPIPPVNYRLAKRTEAPKGP